MRMIDDMGNDQDDLEISDEEKPDISGLFVKQDNKGLLSEEKHSENKNEKIKTKEDNNKEEENKEKEGEEKFYKVIQQETTELKDNELNPIGFKYNIIGNTDNKNEDNEKEDENEIKKENDEEENEEEEDIENINKNIFN